MKIKTEKIKETMIISAFLALGAVIVYGAVYISKQEDAHKEALKQSPEIIKIASIDNCDLNTIDKGTYKGKEFQAICDGVEAQTIITTKKIKIGLRGGYKDTVEIVKPVNNETNKEADGVKDKIVQIRTSRKGKPYLIDVKVKNT